MAIQEKQKPALPKDAHAILIPKGMCSAQLHQRLEMLQSRIHLQEKRKVSKMELVVELLDSHPKMKSL